MPLSHQSRRVCTLTTAELFALCSLRITAPAAREGAELPRACLEGFKIARLTAADAGDLTAGLRTFWTATCGALDIRPAECPDVAADEELLLQILLLLQHANDFGARRLLWRTLSPAAARVVLLHFEKVALGMARAGLMLPETSYAMRPCPAEALVARRLASPTGEPSDLFWLN